MSRRLFRSRFDRKILGVCGGFANYFGIDSSIIRLLWIILIFVFGTGLLAYFACSLIIPEEYDK